jgi:hypothetical protein
MAMIQLQLDSCLHRMAMSRGAYNDARAVTIDEGGDTAKNGVEVIECQMKSAADPQFTLAKSGSAEPTAGRWNFFLMNFEKADIAQKQ